MLGFIEPGPDVNVPCSKFHDPFPRAKARHTGPGAPASAFGTPNAMLARTSQDTAYPSGCPSSVRRSPFGNQPCGHRRCTIPAGHSPAPVPVRSLRTCSCFLCPANMCTGRMTNLHLLNLLSYLSVPFPPQRCDTIIPWPHLLSATSRQVGAKSTAFNFVPTWHEVSSTAALNFLPTWQEV